LDALVQGGFAHPYQGLHLGAAQDAGGAGWQGADGFGPCRILGLGDVSFALA
jgi:hypothetical protein